MKKFLALMLAMIMVVACMTTAFATTLNPWEAESYFEDLGFVYLGHDNNHNLEFAFHDATDAHIAYYTVVSNNKELVVISKDVATATDYVLHTGEGFDTDVDYTYAREANVTKLTNSSKFDVYSAATGVKTGTALFDKFGSTSNSNGTGSVAYYLDKNGQKYVIVSDSEDADIVIKREGSSAVEAYLMKVNTVNYVASAVAFTNIGSKCGQVNCLDKTAKFYTWKIDDVVKYGQKVDVSDTNVLVNGVLVPVSEVGIVEHNFYIAKMVDGVATEVKCSKCGCLATPVKNAVSVPAGKMFVTMNGLGGNYNGVYFDAYNTIPVAKKDDGVTSAKTFDAGIGMYAGMSILAVAGGAGIVGKKKKEDEWA